MSITHRSILQQLAGGDLVDAIERDVKHCVRRARSGPDPAAHSQATIGEVVVDTLLMRWHHILDSDDTVATPLYRHTTALALATALHQQGIQSPALAAKALAAIKALNKAVALSDHFYRKSPDIVRLLKSAPVMPVRRPGLQKSLTRWRAGDVASMQVDDHYHALYVLEISDGAPVVAFYDYLDRTPPTLERLANVPERGTSRTPENSCLDRRALYGLVHQPDPANQFVLLASGADAPDNSRLMRGDALETITDVFRTIQHLRAYL